MGSAWEGDNTPKSEVAKVVPVPIEQIMKDLAQGYSLTYDLEGRKARKYKVYKKIGDVRFEVTLLDHDIIAPQEPGVSLMIFRDSKIEKMDGFTVMGRKRGEVGSYSFSTEEIHAASRPNFWEEYLAAEIDSERREKAIEADNKRSEVTIELASPSLHLALGTGE